MAGIATIHTAGASRPYPGEAANGDAWTVTWDGETCRITVIDALGHGPEAAAVAQRAHVAVEAEPQLDALETLRLCQAVLSGTRGAAVSVATVVPAQGQLTYAGIGNVEAQVWHGAGRVRPICYRGIVGVTQQRVRAEPVALVPPWVLVMYTDGIRARFNLDDYPAAHRMAPQALADAILAAWARPTDDATVVVAGAGAGSPPAP